MFRTITKCAIAAAICIVLLPVSAHAVDYYESNNDGSTHRAYYYDDNYEQQYYTEPCTWKHYGYDYIKYGREGHYHKYECKYCYGDKKEKEDCSWKRTDRYYDLWDGKKHEVKTTYQCSLCYNDKTVKTYKKHNIKWIKNGSSFWYECKDCGEMPKYNGEALYDHNDTDNISIRKSKTYTYEMFYFNKSRNKIKSIKYSKKKICSVKRKGSKLIVKGKKKGKCRVTVTMQSGAKYILNVKVKK